jgi:hypothetical protein
MPIKIIETEKEGHRKVRTPNLKKRPKGKSDLYGTMTYKKGGRTRKQLGGGMNQPLGGGINRPLAGGRMPVRPVGFKHGKRAKKK